MDTGKGGELCSEKVLTASEVKFVQNRPADHYINRAFTTLAIAMM